MKPEQFIREYGVEKAREVVSTGSDTYVFKPEGKKKYVQLSIADLKRLLESIDQINAFDGGIKEAKEILSRINKNGSKYATLFERPALEQAIRDHESIYGGGDE